MKSSSGYIKTSFSYSVIERINSFLRSFFKIFNLEIIIWTIALIYLAFINDAKITHFTICPLSNLGVENCPGCGLGKAITMFFNGDIMGSLKTHILGIPAVIILLYRIVTLIRINLLVQKKLKNRERITNA